MDSSCALLMMGATTPETSLKLEYVMYCIVNFVLIYASKTITLSLFFKILISTASTWEGFVSLCRWMHETQPINVSSSTTAFPPITGDAYQHFVVFLLNYTLEASSVVVPPKAFGLKVWLLKRWPSQLPTFWTFWSCFC